MLTNDQLWYLYLEILKKVDEDISETGMFIADYFDDNDIPVVDNERNTYSVLFALFLHHATLSKMDLISTNGVFYLNIEAMERIAKKGK